MRLYLFAPAALAAVFGIVACKPTPPVSTAAATAPVPAEAPPAAAPAGGQGGATAGQNPNAFTGSIAETMDAGGYTYARLKGDRKDDVWIAAPQFDAKVGETISVSLDMAMPDFESKTLNRKFPLLFFVQEVGRNGQPLSASAQSGPGGPAGPAMMTGHGASAAMTVEKMAPPAGGLSVADVFAKKASLSGKPVTVRGTVVKFNGGIMDRNWLHLQDGSGSGEAKNNDLTITTTAEVKVGDVVTMTGVVGTDKDFGAGYAYDVIVEKATLAGK
jgi:hypothetical protein